ncbi:DNA-binding protein [Halomonas sp. KX33721]|uniref:DNA-binding protein n=1 Tax=Halomonas sp. KX33721 TaxID=1819251 RepID=UPI000ABA89C3|nr:DNA-binding protein [Halomonas sp. KX33721]
MARSGIQYSDVQHAIDTLLTRGDTPSVQRIREVLGTGSFTTISEHFRLWRTEREQNRDVPPPKGVPEVVVNVASELWREAQDVANQALVHYREDANRQVESAQQAAAEALQQAANAEQRESALAAHCRQTEERLETLNRELAESQANERHWQQQAENLRQEAAQHHHQLDQTQQALKEAQTHYSEKLEEQQKSWEQRLAQEEQRNEASEGKLMALLDTLRQERAQEERALQKRLQQWEQRADALSHELKQKK